MDHNRHHHNHHWLTSTPALRAKVEGLEDEDEDEDKSSEIEKVNNIGVIEREHMFDKVVTPSDVGKLNRLVIPKQHAEKYFPLDNNSDQNQKGLLLNFEDTTGKPWRFRYSYWNSSQSYVMTKGWSRFVKDKKLDAGDIVSFQRGVGVGQVDKFFIDWRRRPDINIGPPLPLLLPYNYRSNPGFVLRSIPFPNIPAVWNRNQNQNQDQYNYYNYRGRGTQFPPVAVQSNPVYGLPYVQTARPMIFLRPPSTVSVGEDGGVDRMVIESVPVVQGKRLRLFGVNMNVSNNQGGYDFDDSSSSASASNHINNSNYSDPVHESLQLRLRSDHFHLHKGKSSSSSSMSLDFDF